MEANLFAEYGPEYAASAEPAFVEIPPAKYFTIGGDGAAFSDSWEIALTALLAVENGMKAIVRKQGYEYVMSRLELLRVSDSAWQMLVRVPMFTGVADLRNAKAQARRRPRIDDVEMVRMVEGLCGQILHAAPMVEAATSLAALADFAALNKLHAAGPAHEIYYGDPRRAPEPGRPVIFRVPLQTARQSRAANASG